MNQDEEIKLELFARSQTSAELAELRAENERLRKALEEVASYANDSQGEWACVDIVFAPEEIGPLKEIEDIAREALEVKG